MTLLDELAAAGLNVSGYGDWQNRGGTWAINYGRPQPAGVMHHHTAPPVPYPVHRLIGSRLKANINTKPDGTVWLLAYGACNYSSGPGNYGVLSDVRQGIVPTANARDLGLADNINGNPHYWNFENDHPGDGSPLPKVQFDAIVATTKIVADHFGLDAATQTISHAEHTSRKTDPYWDGDRRAIDTIRAALQEDMMTPDQEAKLDLVLQMLEDNPQDSANDVLFHEITTGFTEPYVRSVLQAIDRTEQRVTRIEAALNELLENL